MRASALLAHDGVSTRASTRALLVGAALVVIWPILLSHFGGGDVYALLGPFALFVIGAVMLVGRREPILPRTGRLLARDLGIGLGVGVVMTVGTYASFALGERLWPPLAGHVGGLYRDAHKENLVFAILATLAAVVAEEILWRGPLLGIVRRKVGVRGAVAISLITYTLACSASRSVIVAVSAVVCGAIWLGERLYTRSIVAPLVSHLMWTTVVVHLLPVTRI